MALQRTVFCAVLLLVCLPFGAAAAQDVGLFSADVGADALVGRPLKLLGGGSLPEDGARERTLGEASPYQEGGSRVADIDFGRLATARSEVGRGRLHPVRLNLFADADFEAVFERTAPTASGYTLTGRLADDPLGTVVFAVNDKVASGLVWGVNGRHSIQAWGGGAVIRREAVRNSLACAGPVRPQGAESAAASAEPRRKANAFNSSLNEAVPPDDGEVVDVLVVYTPLVRGLQGGHRAMRAVIDRDVAMTNEAYRVGGAAQRINLVGAVEVGHGEAPAWLGRSTGVLDGTLLNHLRDRDGDLDEVHALRDSYAADLVLMHTGDLGEVTAGAQGGIAFVPDFVPSEDAASLGFSVSNSWVFAHELGHNMGLRHERERDRSNLPFPYSHGHLLRDLRWYGDDEVRQTGTIMTTIPYALPRFSNPKQNWQYSDEPLGVPGDEPSDSVDGPADAVRSLNGTRRAVANFRASAGRCAYSLSPELPVLPAAGGEFRVRVETAPGCEWTALSDGEFLTIAQGSGGVGGGEVVYRVPANEEWEREAALLIAAEVYLVRQRGVRSFTPACERTPIVSKAISEAAGRPCAEVVASDLASVGSLHLTLRHESDLPQLGDFDGLSNLSTMSIIGLDGYLDQGVLEPGVFDGLSNLRYLQLRSFASFKPGTFDGLGRLTRLTLTSAELVMAPDLFDGLSNLRRLALGGTGITALAPNVFSELSNLEILSLSPNPIAELVPGVFNGLPKLFFLHAAYMQLATLQPGVFDGLANMEVLILGENRLTTLPPDVFDGLAKLESLYLQNNRIAALSPGAFDELANLKRLRLESNHIAALSPGAFDGLPKLGSLDLSGNRLATLPVDAFDELPSLVHLYLSDNRLATLPNGLFAKTTRLFDLDLSDNQLTDLAGGLFAGTRLHGLNLSGNQLTTLPSDLFAGVEWPANRLNLASNLLRALPAGLFDGRDFEDQMAFLALEDNPGAPFSFMAEFVRPSPIGSVPGGPVEIALEVAEGAPFNMRIGLSAVNGSLSSNEALIANGSIQGKALSVTPRGRGAVTLAITEVANDAFRAIPLGESCGRGDLWLGVFCHSGFRTAAGPPLVLYGLPDQTLVERAAVKFHLPSAFPDFGDGTSYAVELSAPSVAGAVVAGGLMTVAAADSGETTVTVTATSAGGRTETRRFTVTVEPPVSSLWGGWRSVLLQQRPSDEDGDGTLEP